MHAAVDPKRTPPAPASWKFGRSAGSIEQGQHTKLVTVEIRLPSGVLWSLVTRVVFVHGSVGNAQATWSQQRALEDRYECVFLTRGGYPPGPPLERIDFEVQADEVAAELREGDHLVGHSYGGVVSLLAAARRPLLASLTVNEPPAFGIAHGNAAVDEFLAGFEAFDAAGPREYLEFFLPLVGSAITLPDPLPPALEQGGRAAMVERPPAEAVIPFDELAAAPFPKLVVSGGHHPAFDAVCDVLEARLGAERAVLPGAGLQRRARGLHRTRRMIETERLSIRPFTTDDAEDLLSIWSDPANERFIGARPPRSVDEVRASIER